MNLKGQTLFIAIIAAVMIFMAGMLFVNPIKDDVNTARSSSNLDCTNLSISDGAKVTCLGADFAIPYFIISILSVAGGLVVARFLI